MDSTTDVAAIIEGLNSESDSDRKLVAFNLQTLVTYADFADAFVQADGMPALCAMVLRESGNSVAYALGSMNGILEQELGWSSVGIEIAERAVEFVTSRSVINVQRNAFRFLVLVVSRPSDNLEYPAGESSIGPTLDSLKPILKHQPDFLAALIEKLSSADHALCANALQFLNALIRDALVTFSESQLMRFVKRLQDLEIFTTVEKLMRAEALDDIATSVLDFQLLTKNMLRCWRMVPVDVERTAHRDALENIRRTAGVALGVEKKSNKGKEAITNGEVDGASWQTVGFATDEPSSEFDRVGLLGLMDLADFVRKNSAFFQRTMLEQSVMPEEQRCPIAQVCLTVTQVLYDHFHIDTSSASPRSSEVLNAQLQGNRDKVIQPLLLCRDKLHGAVAHAFVRLWASSEATIDEYHKVEQLVRLLVTRLIGGTSRQATTDEVEERINRATLAELRRWQLDELDDLQEHAWGTDLGRLRDRLREESVQFVQEQRIRSLLEGSWFPSIPSLSQPDSRPSTPSHAHSETISWRFVQLSPNRRYLHHIAYQEKPAITPILSEMPQRIDVNHISSVVSNVTTSPVPEELLTSQGQRSATPGPVTRLLIHGSSARPHQKDASTPRSQPDESALLELHVPYPSVASEWLDGLLMLLEQQPITSETNKLIDVIAKWSLNVRMLGLGWEDVDWEKIGVEREVPVRPVGVEGGYWYDMGEG